ncbi:hypothetical protein ACIP5Y_21150 [Nocardia sp. NPDC088792]|uniref:hypothetical protein n=1 Tax=Nocardia sp. NPDC088792 TaxID=3364332 RepID=UPI003824E9EB
MSDHPTATFHESQLADYLPPAARRAVSREDLEIAAAYAVYGSGVNGRMVIGAQVVETVGRALVAPIVDAILAMDGIQITFANAIEQPETADA